MRLEDIGFYTLSDERARNASISSPLWRCELILTDECNQRCPYCRGLRPDIAGVMSFRDAASILHLWSADGLRNIRFSGGEPTLWPGLCELTQLAIRGGVKRVAVSTNGTAQELDYYDRLVDAGVNDFSVSLDAGCCSIGDSMAGVNGAWDKAVSTIRHLSKMVYVTVGMVFTNRNIEQAKEAVMFADSLGVSDIRVIPSAQYNRALILLADLPESILAKYPILRYRIGNVQAGRHVRGIQQCDSHQCRLVLDDMAIAGNYHFPCIIYMREGGDPVGKVGANMRSEREAWMLTHDTHNDDICRKNCLDVCIDYNNKAGIEK